MIRRQTDRPNLNDGETYMAKFVNTEQWLRFVSLSKKTTEPMFEINNASRWIEDAAYYTFYDRMGNGYRIVSARPATKYDTEGRGDGLFDPFGGLNNVAIKARLAKNWKLAAAIGAVSWAVLYAMFGWFWPWLFVILPLSFAIALLADEIKFEQKNNK